MSVTQYKQQALRLSAHLSAVHKIRLKHASSHEAIAAMHGVKDWNTLLSRPPLSTEISQITAPHRTGAVSRLFPEQSFRDAGLCKDILSLSAVSLGGPSAEREVLLGHLLSHQVSDGGFLFLDFEGGARRPRIAQAMATAGRASAFKILDFNSPDNGETINPFSGMSPEGIGHAVAALLPGERSPGADYYRQAAQVVIRNFAVALGEGNREISMPALFEALHAPGQAITELSLALPPSSPGGLAMAALAALYGNGSSGKIDESKLIQVLGGVRGRLAQTLLGNFGAVFAAKSASLSLRAALTAGHGVYANFGGASAGSPPAKLLVHNLMASLSSVSGNERPRFTLFVVGANVADLLPTTFLQCAQTANIGVLCFDSSPKLLLEQSAWDLRLDVGAASGVGQPAVVSIQQLNSGRTLAVNLHNSGQLAL